MAKESCGKIDISRSAKWPTASPTWGAVLGRLGVPEIVGGMRPPSFSGLFPRRLLTWAPTSLCPLGFQAPHYLPLVLTGLQNGAELSGVQGGLLGWRDTCKLLLPIGARACFPRTGQNWGHTHFSYTEQHTVFQMRELSLMGMASWS